MIPDFLLRPDGECLAYHQTPGRSPGVVFLGGLRSDMGGIKATRLDAWCRARGQAFLRFDPYGHGRSSGDFARGTVSRWAADALAVLDTLTEGPQLLVGSSMGGWLALLAARARADRVAGLLGIAAAPDFTEDLIWAGLSEAERVRLLAAGRIERPSDYGDGPYPITRALVEDGRRHLLLRQGGEPLRLDCPVRLLAGMRDADVPWQTSLRLSEALVGADVRLTLIKDGDHRLSRETDLALLEATLAELLEAVA